MQNIIGHNIRKFRLQKGITQAQLAAACDGRSVNQLNGYERGRSRPSPALIHIIANALGVSSLDLTRDDVQSNIAPANVAEIIEQLRGLMAEAHNVAPSAVRISFEVSV